MLRDSYANQFVECDGKTIVYQVTYDEELVSEGIDAWLNKIKKFGQEYMADLIQARSQTMSSFCQIF